MLVTTYQHDYVSPYSKRYEFLKGLNQGEKGDKDKEVCQCIEETKVEIPKAAEKCETGVEWTGIAPMGRLIEPRIIPAKFTAEQLAGFGGDEQKDCFKEQPNRFLKILRTAYPDLYERLKQMPKDEMSRRLDRERLFTTYQIDYCNMNEYPEGIYESLKDKDHDDASKLYTSKLLTAEGPCAEFRANVMSELEQEQNVTKIQDPCEKAYKPFKISFTDSARFVASGNNSHWRSSVFSKRADLTEYMDTINRSGCIIMRNKIHDHSKCSGGKHCRHILLRMCTDIKA